jgi:hypothetical protein
MNIPAKSGKTSLAYITNEERKLLRRRDAVKGSPNKKTTHGIPRLEGWETMMEEKRAKEIRAKEDALRAAGFEERIIHGGGDAGGGDFGWFHAGKKLSAGVPGAPGTPKPTSRPLGIPHEKWGAATTPKVEPIKVAETPAPSGGGSSSRPAPRPAPTPAPSPPAAPAAPAAPSYSSEVSSSAIDPDQLQQPMLDEIVADGVNSELLETRLTNLINKNNPLFKAATTKTMQAMAARGLVNSSIAEEAVMSAILSVAIPIAERDASAYMNQRMQNQAYSNEFRTQQNKAYYESFLQKLQHSMDMAMRQLSERSANWRAVLAARSNITTTPGMSADATSAGMAAVTPDWWNA